MYSSSLLRNGLLRKCLVTKYFPRVWLSQQTCLMALATLRQGVSGPATSALPTFRSLQWLLRGNVHCTGGVSTGPAWTPVALWLCTGTWLSRVPRHGFGTNTVRHRSVLLLWFLCYCFTVFALFLLFLSEVVTWFSHCQNELEVDSMWPFRGGR